MLTSAPFRPRWIALAVALALAAAALAGTGVAAHSGSESGEVADYHHLHPTGSQPGEPSTFEARPGVQGGQSPDIIAATTESPPQAQLIARRDAFVVPAGVTTLRVTIDPVDPAIQPTDGSIAGNVYRFAVTDEAGNPLALKTCPGCVALVLRAPEAAPDATIARLVDGQWRPLATEDAGGTAMYQTEPDALGDYVVLTGLSGEPGGEGSAGAAPWIAAGALAITILPLALLGLYLFRRRGDTRPTPRSNGTPGTGTTAAP